MLTVVTRILFHGPCCITADYLEEKCMCMYMLSVYICHSVSLQSNPLKWIALGPDHEYPALIHVLYLTLCLSVSKLSGEMSEKSPETHTHTHTHTTV